MNHARHLPVIAALATVFGVSPTTAQEPITFEHPDAVGLPANTLVARFRIEPAALESVGTTAEFVAALRRSLEVEAAMPLDEPLRVGLYVLVYSPDGGMPVTFQTDLFGFGLEGGSAVRRPLAEVVRASREAETFTDWNEEESWDALVDILDRALSSPSSPVAYASGVRPPGADGHASMRIAAIHYVSDEEWREGGVEFARDYVELRPSATFASSAMAGWEPPEGLAYDTGSLFLELEPAPPAAAAAPPADAVELPAEVLDRYVGSYEMGPGTFVDLRRDDGALIASARGEEADEAELRLIPVSETAFVAQADGRTIAFTFRLDASGAVESVTLEQDGFSQTLPRVP